MLGGGGGNQRILVMSAINRIISKIFSGHVEMNVSQACNKKTGYDLIIGKTSGQ